MASELRALSVRQPFAWAICAGVKTIENRTWTTDRRGTIAIHASTSAQNVNALNRHIGAGAPTRDYFTFGAIIGLAEIVDVTSYGPEHEIDFHATGPYCWRMANGRLLKKPIEIKGKLNLFKLSTDLQQEILNAETFAVDLNADEKAMVLAKGMDGTPDPIDCYLALFEEFLHTRNHEAAVHVAVDRLMELAPDNPEALTAKATIEMGEDSGSAIARFKQALAIDPEYTEAWANLAAAYATTADWNAMEQAAQRFVALSPDHWFAYELRSEALANLGNLDAALVDCDRSIELNDENPGAKELRAAIVKKLAEG